MSSSDRRVRSFVFAQGDGIWVMILGLVTKLAVPWLELFRRPSPSFCVSALC